MTAARETVKPLSRFTAVKVVTCIRYFQIRIKVTVYQTGTIKFIINSKNLKSKVLVQY